MVKAHNRMKILINILFVFLFFLQGAADSSLLTVITILFLVFTLFLQQGKMPTFPGYFLLAFAIYIFYLSIGLFNNHPNAHIDIKFQLFFFAFYFWLINNRFNIDFLKLLFAINGIVLVIYLLLYLDIMPNFWNENTFGRQGRVLGPAITPMVYILFNYLYTNKKFDRRLGVSLMGAMIYILMTSNFMNLAIVSALSLLVVINFKQLLKPIYIAGIMILGLLLVLYINSPFVPEMISSKLEYIFKPWEYGTVKTRIADLQQALDNENFGVFQKLFGEGYGASSNIYRENKLSPSLSRTFAFQEIDNGFYYLYHRGGWSLLVLFFVSHIYLITKTPRIKAKIGFFVIILITNALSIHYFNYLFYLILPFWILHKRIEKRN